MRTLLALAVAATVVLTGCALAQPRPGHAAHHPAGAPMPAEMQMQMQSMQAMHDKLMAAKTPAERQALMADHMKAMQGGMAMMGQMKGPGGHGGGKPMCAEMMGGRMEMMEMMMQMMMGREAARAPAVE